MKPAWFILALFLCGSSSVQAQLVLDWNSGFADGGIVHSDVQSWHDTRTLGGISGPVVKVEVRIHLTEDLQEGNNGDLYAYLSHGGQLVVLLNRVGRDSQNEYGYLDAGFDITLSDSAMTDVHFYGGNNGNLVTGSYQADGRNIDPTSARALFEAGPRQSTGTPLALFNGMDPNGDWVLHISDHGAVGTSTVVSWGMTIMVPEPSQVVMASAILCCLVVLTRKYGLSEVVHRRGSGPPGPPPPRRCISPANAKEHKFT